MRIGELSERTGTPRRLLRYYEEQELITPERREEIIKQLLPCLSQSQAIYCPEDATPERIATLERDHDRIAERIRFLTRNRDAIATYLATIRDTSQ